MAFSSGKGGKGGSKGGGSKGKGKGKGDGKGKGSKGKGKGSKGKGKGKGGKGKGGKGAKAGSKVEVIPHRHPGIFVAKGKDDAIVTKNMDPGTSVYGEKRISTEIDDTKTEYRVWNPFRSKLCAAVVAGVEDIHVAPGVKLLYLGAASGTTVSHCSDVVGPEGMVYAVEFSARPGRDLINMAKKRTNIIPIVEDARYPLKYRMLLGMVDVIFADVAQPNQAQIVAHNAEYFLKNGGHFVISIKANCIDSTQKAEVVFGHEINRLKELGFKPHEYVTLEPYERDHCVVIGSYRGATKS